MSGRRDQPVPAQQEGQNEEQRQQGGGLQQFFSIAQRLLLFWLISQLITKFLSKPKSSEPAVVVPSTHDAAPSSPHVPSGQQDPRQLPPQQVFLGWPLGITLDMHVYLSNSPAGDVLSSKWANGWKKKEDVNFPHFVWENITFGNWDDTRSIDLDVPLPPSVQHNASLWADVFLVKGGANPDPSEPRFDPSSVHHTRKLLTHYFPRAKTRKVKSLLSGKDNDDGDIVQEESEQPDVIVSHWHKNLTLALVSDGGPISYTQLPPPVFEHIHLIPGLRDETGTKGFYKPIIFPNDFWHLRSQYFELNETTIRVPLHIDFQPMSYFKFQLFATMGQGFKDAAQQQGGGANAEIDEIKRMLVETNPYFLGLTAIVTILHSVFEMLAFKNDVSHWRKKDELTGVSVRQIVSNVFVQLIILLYLLDNNDNTSYIILFGQGIGMAIEAWKITKAVDVKLVNSSPGSFLPFKIVVKDKHVLSEDEKKTQEYDKLAFRYVSYVTIPALAAYTIYSLIYETHRGWYSFVISTLTSFVYMFGFVQLVPQLIINYKLKSVAHMPMKAMIYKTLSTVVDDLFAFCIKMPILHRLACFRDDVVFLVFLYQRWIYRIDPKRINEYGQVMVTDQDTADSKGEEPKKTR